MAELFLAAKETIKVDEKTTIFGESPKGRFLTVFEDDGETGYFYALDEENSENKICDALHIYNVESIIDGEVYLEFQITWSEDGLKSTLLINDYPHTVFDFSEKRGYCRTNFPPSNKNWTKFEHEWTDKALDLFK